MDDLQNLYQEVIIDHSQHPRNFRVCQDANHKREGYNPLCGDRLTLYVKEKNGVVEDISFQGSGCAIFMASSSMLTEMLRGKTLAEIKPLYNAFHGLVTSGDQSKLPKEAKKLAVFAGVSEFPMRVKCAILPWHTLKAALTTKNEDNSKKIGSNV
ncbi:MAG: SUF system NifU family Fe-S cluster assembly protein [Gammaproteobacteria bacterium]